MIYQHLLDKTEKIAVIGQGYVGLPIALAFAKHTSVIGYDISQEKIEKLRQNEDPSGEIPSEDFEGRDIHFSYNLEELREATCFIMAVPTPIDQSNIPNLKPLLSATRTVAQVIKPGDYIIYESTVYPGCTEEDCIPILEEVSGLTFNDDFKVGYSPERINPGDKKHTLASIIKVVAAGCPESLEEVAKLYEMVVEAGIHRASSIRVAEAAKIIENTQRDLNIALMNELSIIFQKMNINTYEVLEAAGTKWNFLKFTPGLVGGHCIGVDPFYLTYKASRLGHNPELILSGRSINDSMGRHVATNTLKMILKNGKSMANLKVLVMGTTFKENVRDIRNSKVVDIVREFREFNVEVDVVDPMADSDELEREYGFALSPQVRPPYDAIVVAVNHQPYVDLNERYFASISRDKGVLVDVKGIFRGKIKQMGYWSL